MTPEKRLETLRKLVDQKPGDAFARYSLAMSYRAAGRTDEAVEEFRELARREPGYVPTYLMWGQALESMGRGVEAARVYREGMEAATGAHEDHARQKLSEALENLKSEGE